jgi:cytidylate kinase-like protein
VVCISHATGAGGEEVGRLVAERLGFLYVDEDIVAHAAARGGIGPGEVADEERRKTLVARLLEGMSQGGEAWALAAAAPPGAGAGASLSRDDVRGLIRETVEQTAGRGNVVIVAHAASHAIDPGAHALRVLVTASPATRARRLGEAEGLDEARSARAIKDSDAGRRDYLRRLYEIREELPTHYDLVVNTDVLSVERAADLVSHAAVGG